jgi:phosphatidylglycerol:prolipoprotein diacylglycerol transferase
LLGAVLLVLVYRRGWLKRPGQTFGLFLAGYGGARFFVEFFRQADAQYITPDNPMGYVIQLGGAGLSMGQVLSLPMILIGLALIRHARAR